MKLQETAGCNVWIYALANALLAVFLVLFSVPTLFAAQPAGQANIQLTDAEKEWLTKHQRIQVGIMDAWPPLNYIDQNRTPKGIGVDYLAALNKRLGGALVPVPAPFKQNYDRVLNRQLDAIMDITQRPDRETVFTFTRPYIVISHVIVGRKGDYYFRTEKDLAGKTIALERGFHNVTYFKKNYPAVNIREYASTAEALDAVSRAEVDAYAGNRAVVIHLIEKELLNNLRLMGKLTEPKSILQIGVQKEQSLLASILDKALASLSVDEERAILQKWLLESRHSLDLTDAEKAWLKAHPNIRVALDPAWAPVEFLDEYGIPQGIAADYIKKIEDLLGIFFDIAKGQDWQSLVEGIKKRNLDMFSSLLRTEEGEDYLGFTDSYLSLPIGIFTRQDAQYITSMNELVGKKIAVIKSHAAERFLKSKHPDLKLLPFTSIVDALQKLAQGDVDAVVDSTITTGYYLNKLGLTNIKLAGETPYHYELSMGIRSDWPELLSILNKAFRTMPESEHNAVYSKWTSLKQDSKIDYSLIWKIVAGALVVLALLAFWNRRLGSEISIRKQAEASLQASRSELINIVADLNIKKEELEAANNKLKDLDRLKSMFLASMSHELRTPLNSIIGFTGIIIQGLAGPLNEEQAKQLGMIRGSANHLLSLINDILDISKIEAGEMALSQDTCDMHLVIKKVVQSTQPLADKKGLSLLADIGPGIGTIISDMRRIEQIMLNLLSNAIKFTEKGKVRIECSSEGDRIVVSVADEGIGIREEDIPGLFTAFYQVDTGLSRRYEGTGLGLSICKRLIELLGGEIWVKSEWGKGSSFGFSLPVVKKAGTDKGDV